MPKHKQRRRRCTTMLLRGHTLRCLSVAAKSLDIAGCTSTITKALSGYCQSARPPKTRVPTICFLLLAAPLLRLAAAFLFRVGGVLNVSVCDSQGFCGNQPIWCHRVPRAHACLCHLLVARSAQHCQRHAHRLHRWCRCCAEPLQSFCRPLQAYVGLCLTLASVAEVS